MTHSIPSRRSIETHREVRACIVIARGDVCQRGRHVRVQPWVQEPQHRTARRNELVIQEGDDARERRARAARSVDGPLRAAVDDIEVDGVRRDVGDRAAARVVQTGVGIPKVVQVLSDGGFLVGRPSPVVREAAAREVGSNFRY